MRILITGINGFIGRQLTQLLLSARHQVRGLVLPNEKVYLPDQKEVVLFRGDLNQPESIRNICKDIDLVIHLAARVADWGSKKLFYQSIVHATENLLKEATENGVKRFVHTSSIAACGMGRHLNFPNENAAIYKSGIPYNDAKLDSEKLVWSYTKQYSQLKATVIRPANVIGPGSVWVKDPLAQMSKFFGLPLIDGGKYDACLIDVENLADGIAKAAFSEKAENQTYFLMDDWGITWKQYLTDLGQLVGKKPGKALSFQFVWRLGSLTEALYLPFGVRPPVTRLGASLIGRDNLVNTRKARAELDWHSRISYQEAMMKISDWLNPPSCTH